MGFYLVMSCRGGGTTKNVSSGDSLRIDIPVIITGGDSGTFFKLVCVGRKENATSCKYKTYLVILGLDTKWTRSKMRILITTQLTKIFCEVHYYLSCQHLTTTKWGLELGLSLVAA